MVKQTQQGCRIAKMMQESTRIGKTIEGETLENAFFKLTFYKLSRR